MHAEREQRRPCAGKEKVVTQDEVILLMDSSKTEQEWNDNCDKVKAAHDGRYPDYWFMSIVLSGLRDRCVEKFSK